MSVYPPRIVTFNPLKQIMNHRGKGTSSPRRKASSPHGVPNNGEYAYLRAGNLLYDPGLELYIGNAVASYDWRDWEAKVGHHHYALPRFSFDRPYGQYWPDNSDVAYVDIAQWMQHTEPYVCNDTASDSAWHVTTADPNLGTFSLVWWRWDASTKYGGAGVPGGLCIQAPGLPQGYSGRAHAGDLVTFSAKVRVTIPRTGVPTVVPYLYFFNEAGSPTLGTATAPFTLTELYTEPTVSSSAPGGTYWFRAGMVFKGTDVVPYCSTLVDSGLLSVE